MSAKVTAVGIDLGTTFSAASYVDPSGQTQMIPNSTGGTLTPSAVYFDQDNIVVGAAALKARLVSPDRVAEHAKRDMGAAHYRHTLLGEQFPPEVIQGCILRQLREDIAKVVPGDFRVVITVPAYFDEARRKVTADAGTMSGLEVLDIVNEPTSAALAFGERLGYLLPEGAPRDCLRLVVYDLGGGTFDVTVMELSAGKVKTLATDGDYELGGLHWDQRLAEYAEERFRKLWPDAGPFDPAAQARLQMAARTAKHQLSSSPLATFQFEFEGHQLSLPVQRSEFEELTADLVERTIFTTNHALKAANLLWNDVDRLLLVGGSTRMPAIRAAIKNTSGITPDDAVHPDEAVARGASIYARNLLVERGIDTTAPKLSITDVNSHGLGIEGVNLETQRVENITLIPRNTPLPYEVKRQFVTRTDNQRSIKVQLLEGESTLPKQCSPLAVAAIKHLPPGLPKGTPVAVTYTLEANGRVTVKAEVSGVGDQAQIELERVRGLSDQKVNAWKTVLCRHGGFRDFEDSIVAMLRDEPPAKTPPQDEPTPAPIPQPTPPRPKASLQPAIDHGAPQAASDTLRSHAQQTSARPTPKPIPQRPVPQRSVPQRPATSQAQQPAITPQVTTHSKRRVVDLAPFAMALGHVAAGIVGLALGYYALCFVRPDLNVLELPLPGVEATANAEP